MTDTDDLLAEAVARRKARPWLHETPDGQPHFYVRTTPLNPGDVDLAAELVAAIEREAIGRICEADDGW